MKQIPAVVIHVVVAVGVVVVVGVVVGVVVVVRVVVIVGVVVVDVDALNIKRYHMCLCISYSNFLFLK